MLPFSLHTSTPTNWYVHIMLQSGNLGNGTTYLYEELCKERLLLAIECLAQMTCRGEIKT